VRAFRARREFQVFHPANDFVERAEAERGEIFTRFLRDELEVRHDPLRIIWEFLAQVLALGRDAGRARVVVTSPRHDAASRDHHRGAKRKFIRPQQRRNDDMPGRLETTVDADADTPAQIVRDQDLLCLRESQFPRDAYVLHRREGGRACRPNVR